MVSADDATIGAGLGLTITRGVIEAHGGDISAHSPLPDELRALIAPLRASSAPYRGTALIFTLPASDQAQQLGAKRSV
jgi:signal transduction histidine kinase